VLGQRSAGAQLHRAGGRREDRQDLVEDDGVGQLGAQELNRGAGSDHPAVLVEQRVAVPGGEDGKPLGELRPADQARGHAVALEEVMLLSPPRAE
jgi:hypothetical protein